MVRFVSKAWLRGCLVLLLVTGAEAGNDTYEPTQPPRIIAVAADARSFYLEFRARNEVGGFGHSYSPLAQSILLVGGTRPSSLASCRGARMTTIGASLVYRLQDC